MRKITLFLMFLLTSLTWAQEEQSMSTCEVANRAPAPKAFKAPARRAQALATWSYPSSAPQNPFAGGSGTESSPYQIATAQQLANMAYLVNNSTNYQGAYYELLNDIVLNEGILNESRELVAAGQQWVPIGNYSRVFKGHFNGKGFSVKGIYIYSSKEYNGLFGYIAGAVVENVGVEDGYIYGCCRTGGVAGLASNSTITNCFNTCVMYSKSSLLAGILGQSAGNTKVVACYNAGKVHCYGQYCGSHGRNGNCAGGIVGAVDSGGSVSYCYNTGSVYCGAYGSCGIASPHNHTGLVLTSCHNYGNITCYNKSATGAVVASYAGYGFSISPSVKLAYGLVNSSPSHNYSTEKSAEEFANSTVLNLLDPSGDYFIQGSLYPVLKGVGEGVVKQAEEVVVAEGQCGENVYWKLTEDGELIISGTGRMYDYGIEAIGYIQKVGPTMILAAIRKFGVQTAIAQIKSVIEQDPSGLGLAPWINLSNSITKITVEEGVTTIGQGAFLLLTSVTEATLPSTITEVGTGALAFCTALTNLSCYSQEPPALTGIYSDYTFCYTGNMSTDNYNNPYLCTLHVCPISKAKYAEAEGWKLFTKVSDDLEARFDPVLNLVDDAVAIVSGTYKAGNVTYTRTQGIGYAGAYATFCLPFNTDMAHAKGVTAIYVPFGIAVLDAGMSSLGIFFKEQEGIIPAGTPFVAVVSGDGSKPFFQSTDETTLTETPEAREVGIEVFTSLTGGGVLKPASDIHLTWRGTFSTGTPSGAWKVAEDGSLEETANVTAYDTYITLRNDSGEDIGNLGGFEPNADLNGDGRVTIADVTTLVNIILNQK